MPKNRSKRKSKKDVAKRKLGGGSFDAVSGENDFASLIEKIRSTGELDPMISSILHGTAFEQDLYSDEAHLISDAVTVSQPLGKVSKQARKRLQQWQDWACKLRSTGFEGLSEGVAYGSNFEFESIRKDGLIVGECIIDDETNRFFVNLDPKSTMQPRVGCDCLQSLGVAPCVHTLSFTDWLDEVLHYDASGFSRIVLEQDFSEDEPDLSGLAELSEEKVKRFLDLQTPIPAAQFDVENDDDLTSLPESETTARPRICWDLEMSSKTPDIRIRLQQPKKRGVGWTKGRLVNASNLLSAIEFASETDRRLIGSLADRASFYSKSLTFPVVETCFELIGCDNVTIDGKPAQVERFVPTLEYVEDELSCSVNIKNPLRDDVPFHLFGTDRKLAFVAKPEGLILVAEASEQVVSTLRALLQMPALPLAAKKQLVEHLQSFRHMLPIELPEDSSEILQAEQTQPVLLLRSQENGTLDYGIRLRGSQGKLYRATEGPLVVDGTSNKTGSSKSKSRKKKADENRPRLQRSPQKELQQVRQTLDHLALPTEKPGGSVTDIAEALSLLESVQELESAGAIEVLWDKASVAPVRVLGAVTPQNLKVQIGQSRDWLQLKGEADLQFGSLELSELMRGLEEGHSTGDYVKFGDKGWAKVSRRLRRQLVKVRDSVHEDRKKLTFDSTSVPALRELLAENSSLETSSRWDQCVARMEEANQLQPVVPESLDAKLRSYQDEGFSWLRRLAHWQVGGILADDMGLGKTLQALAVILDLAAEGPALIVAPTSVGFNWQSESERFAPNLNVHQYRESERQSLLDNVTAGDVVICSYGLLLRDREMLASVEWSVFVLDEAQAVKNSRSKTAVAAKAIPAKWKLALTGTPMENHLGELWSIFHVVAPGVLGGWESFRKRYAVPIEKGQDESRRMALRERIKPFILRRKKSEVLHDLPPRHNQNILVELSPEERKIYDTARATALLETDEIAGLSDVKDQRFRLLALLTRLRQIACSPKMVDENFVGRSSKLKQLAETLHQLKCECHRVLVFSQFVKHLHLIRDMLTEEDFSFEYLDGSTSAKARKESVARFQQGDALAFLISLKAGGTGLNLTAADYVIHMDPWWNPAIEDQATDRAHRIGQTSSVMCYRLIAKQTIEEEILKLHDEKRDLVAGVLEGSASAGKLSTEDLIDLIRNRAR